MHKIIIRRFLISIPVLLIVITATFFFIRVAPGGPFDSERVVSPEILRNLNERYNLNDPVYLQYFGLLLIMINVFCLLAQRTSVSSNTPGRGYYPLAFAIVYLIVAMTSVSNIASIKQRNKLSYPVKMLRLALANNILADEDEDIVLLLKDKYLYNMRHYQYLFYEYIGRYISVSTVDEYLDKMRAGGVS